MSRIIILSRKFLGISNHCQCFPSIYLFFFFILSSGSYRDIYKIWVAPTHLTLLFETALLVYNHMYASMASVFASTTEKNTVFSVSLTFGFWTTYKSRWNHCITPERCMWDSCHFLISLPWLCFIGSPVYKCLFQRCRGDLWRGLLLEV